MAREAPALTYYLNAGPAAWELPAYRHIVMASFLSRPLLSVDSLIKAPAGSHAYENVPLPVLRIGENAIHRGGRFVRRGSGLPLQRLQQGMERGAGYGEPPR